MDILLIFVLIIVWLASFDIKIDDLESRIKELEDEK
jgi:hypothetical protein